jgi:hypothetical protein
MASAQATRRSEPPPVTKPGAAPLIMGDERFSVGLKPLKAGPLTGIDDSVTDFSWEDQNAEMTGSLAITDPTGSLRVIQGQQIVCSWTPTPGGAMDELWTLRADSPEIGRQQQTLSIALLSGLAQANKGTDNYSFKKGKRKPHGWTCDEIGREVEKRTHIPIGKLAKGSHRIVNLVKHAAKPLDVIVAAYQAERRATGRLFFVYWDGKLNIVPLSPSGQLLRFAGEIIDANLKEAMRADFATAITVRATTKGKERVNKAGHKVKVARSSKKIHVTVQSAAGIRQYGYVHREVKAPDVQTVAQARAYGLKQLAKVVNPERTFTVTVPIMPTLRRGMAFNVNWESQGLTQTCYVAGLSHSVAPSSATTAVTATFTNPFKDSKAAADAKARATTAKARGRTGGTEAPATTGGSSAQAQRRY